MPTSSVLHVPLMAGQELTGLLSPGVRRRRPGPRRRHAGAGRRAGSRHRRDGRRRGGRRRASTAARDHRGALRRGDGRRGGDRARRGRPPTARGVRGDRLHGSPSGGLLQLDRLARLSGRTSWSGTPRCRSAPTSRVTEAARTRTSRCGSSTGESWQARFPRVVPSLLAGDAGRRRPPAARRRAGGGHARGHASPGRVPSVRTSAPSCSPSPPRRRWRSSGPRWPTRGARSPTPSSAACCPRGLPGSTGLGRRRALPARRRRHARPAATGTTCCPLDDGRVALAVGDVVGAGRAGAAAVMGQLRTALSRATCCWHGLRPRGPSACSTASPPASPGSRATTVACLLLDPGTGRADLQPAPATCRRCSSTPTRRGRTSTTPRATGSLLGLPPPAPRPRRGRRRPSTRARPCVLYTDGLVERRGDALDDGVRPARRRSADQYRAAPTPEPLRARCCATSSTPGGLGRRRPRRRPAAAARRCGSTSRRDPLRLAELRRTLGLRRSPPALDSPTPSTTSSSRSARPRRTPSSTPTATPPSPARCASGWPADADGDHRRRRIQRPRHLADRRRSTPATAAAG